MHTHAPPTHCCPAAQTAPLPQAQVPEEVQVSARSGSQAAHAPPIVPHVEGVAALHVVPLQQPEGHEVESQTQAPDTQRWPAPHWAFEPQRHSPVAQLSADVALQLPHAPPPLPQSVVEVPTWH